MSFYQLKIKNKRELRLCLLYLQRYKLSYLLFAQFYDGFMWILVELTPISLQNLIAESDKYSSILFPIYGELGQISLFVDA